MTLLALKKSQSSRKSAEPVNTGQICSQYKARMTDKVAPNIAEHVKKVS